MSFRINHNQAAFAATSSLFQASQRVADQLGVLASGLRVPSARFDAAGLAISEGMRARVSSLGAASRNIQDGQALAAIVVEGIEALQEVVHRQEELALRAFNDTLSPEDRTLLQAQNLSNADEMDRIVSSIIVNGRSVLSVDDTITIQLGVDEDDTLSFDLPGTLLSTMSPGYRNVTLENDFGAEWVMRLNDLFNERLNGIRGEYGAAMNRMDSALSSLLIERQNLSAAESRIRDADMANETAVLTRELIRQEAASSVLVQANVQSELALQLLAIDVS